jgi:hypothetical protein
MAGNFPLVMEQAEAGVDPLLLNLPGACNAITGEAPLLPVDVRLALKLNVIGPEG